MLAWMLTLKLDESTATTTTTTNNDNDNDNDENDNNELGGKGTGSMISPEEEWPRVK